MSVDVAEISALAVRVHATAVEKGFWDFERNKGEMLMLVSSELAEALEAHRAGRPGFYIEYAKPEGVVVELADVIIRCLDTLAFSYNSSVGALVERSRKIQSHGGGMYKLTDNFGENLLSITAVLIRARINPAWLADVIVMCERLTEAVYPDDKIWDSVYLKMDYNNTRPHMHGKAY